MKASALREKSLGELRAELDGLLHQQFKLRMRHGAGQLPQFHQLKQARRDVARIRTVIQQKIASGETQ